MKKILLTLLTSSLLASVASVAHAGSTMMASGKSSKEMKQVMPPECDLYRANEFSVDLFGVYNVSGSGTQDLFGDHAFGGGLAVNYFFTKMIGVGLEGQAFEARHGETLGSAALNFTFRFPIGCTGWAPYAYLGGGIISNTDSVDDDTFEDASQDGDDYLWEGHAGAGISYRFTKNIGVFTDGRYTVAEADQNNFMSVRTGVTFAF